MKFERFVKLMQMTTSDNDGEALSALRRANAMLKAERKNWEDLVAGLVRMESEEKKDYTNDFGNTVYEEDVNSMFEKAFANVRPNSSFRETVEGIHKWWLSKHFLSERQFQTIRKAAGR
jgi:hypothetical protein